MTLENPFLRRLALGNRRAVGLIAGALAMCVLMVALAIRPLRARIAENRQTLEKLRQHYALMRKNLETANALTQQAATLRERRDAMLDAGLLEPLLGSFAMRGKALLDPAIRASGVQVESVRELAALPLQFPTPPPTQTYARQPVEFTLQGRYSEIVALIEHVEQAHPMVTLSSLQIQAQQQSPEIHRAIIAFEWPIQGEKLAEAPQAETGGQKP